MAFDWVTVISIIVIMFCAGIGFVIFLSERRFKHKVTIREFANGRKLIIEDKAKEVISKDNKSYWVLRKERDPIKRNMPLPPSESVEITKKGKKHVDVYRTELGEYVFVKDSTQIKEPPQSLLDEIKDVPEEILNIESSSEKFKKIQDRKNKLLSEWRKDNNVVSNFNFVTNNQRMSLVDSIQKAKERQNDDWKDKLPTILLSGAVVMLFICALIFAPDIIKEYTKGDEMRMQNRIHYEKVTHDMRMIEYEKLDTIYKGIQEINSKTEQNADRIGELESINPK